MKTANLMVAAFVLASAAAPVIAQTSPNTMGTTQTNPMPASPNQPMPDQKNGKNNGTMSNGMAPTTTMSSADMRKMKSCKKMSQSSMMKSKSCSAMMQAHPDMMDNSGMTPKR